MADPKRSRRDSPRRALRASAAGDQLDIDQRCVPCRTGAHRACASKTCPCPDRRHDRETPDA